MKLPVSLFPFVDVAARVLVEIVHDLPLQLPLLFLGVVTLVLVLVSLEAHFFRVFRQRNPLQIRFVGAAFARLLRTRFLRPANAFSFGFLTIIAKALFAHDRVRVFGPPLTTV